MRVHAFGSLPAVSTLTLGGGGLGMLWGPTTFDECVATVHEAVAAGITLLDLAPRYGDGKAEEVVGAAFGGRLPDGVRVTSKCNLGEPPPRPNRRDTAAVDRGEPGAATTDPVGSLLSAFQHRTRCRIRGAVARCGRAHDAL